MLQVGSVADQEVPYDTQSWGYEIWWFLNSQSNQPEPAKGSSQNKGQRALKLCGKISWFNRGHYITNPNNALLRGNPIKSPIYLPYICIVDPSKLGHLSPKPRQASNSNQRWRRLSARSNSPQLRPQCCGQTSRPSKAWERSTNNKHPLLVPHVVRANCASFTHNSVASQVA